MKITVFWAVKPCSWLCFGEHRASIFKVARGQTLGRLLIPATDWKVHHKAQQSFH